MKRFLTRFSRSKYDPLVYWNSRSNPNNAQGVSPERVKFDVDYLRGAIFEYDTILELGPGVGRTFSVYSNNHYVTTLDISKKYQNDLLLIAKKLGVNLEQKFLLDPLADFPFEGCSFEMGVSSQVLMHIPPEFIQHTLQELVRVCKKIVIITCYQHGQPLVISGVDHVFNHDYFSLCTNLGCAMHDVIMNEGRICFTLSKRQGSVDC